MVEERFFGIDVREFGVGALVPEVELFVYLVYVCFCEIELANGNVLGVDEHFEWRGEVERVGGGVCDGVIEYGTDDGE